MSADFAEILKSYSKEAMKDGSARLRRALREVGDVVVRAFDSEIDRIDVNSENILDTIEVARSAAEVVDACHIIQARLYTVGNNDCFREFGLPRRRAYDVLSDFIDTDVRDSIDVRPFVYVIWNRRPEVCFYVGRSENKDGRATRLKLEGRGKLLEALHLGSLMTLMLPSPRTSTVALDVEAAVLAVLHNRKRPPILNSKIEKVPGTLGSAHLSRIGRLLGELAVHFKHPIEQDGGDLLMLKRKESRTNDLPSRISRIY